jgi:quercetin dioxygenase-like cupin family protein
VRKVENWDEARDGALSEGALRSKLEDRGFDVARYVYAPGTTFPSHSHDADKMDAVLSGRFRIDMLGLSFTLGPGDVLLVPAGVIHSAQVVGTEAVVSLDGEKRP